MNFTESISYAIKLEHLPKALTIVLVGMILSVSVLVLAVAFQAPLLALFLIPVMLAYHLFVNGYKVSVTRTVMEGHEQLPALNFAQNLGRGAVVFIATLIYTIPFIVLYALFGVLIFAFQDAGAGIVLVMCGGALLLFFAVIVISMSYYLGLARYAAQDSAGALFNIGKNFGIVMSNLGTSWAFFWRVTTIAMAFSILGTMITNVISPFFSSAIENAFEALVYNELDALANLTAPLLILGTLYFTITLATNLVSGFGASHLLAGFGAELGFGGHNLRDTGNRGNTTAIAMLILTVVVVLALVAFAAFIFVMILGPEMSDIASEILREIESMR